MVKRRRLETPSSADLDRIERQFRSETGERPSLAGGIAPIAQVAAETAARANTETADARAERAKLEADSARLHSAREQGLLMVELPLDQIDEGAMIRDRMTISEDDMNELRQSIAAHGLRLPIEVFELEKPGRDGRRYGLLSGYRRLLAMRGLLEMTEGSKYSVIRALIRPRTEADGAFISMIEENEVREELSHFERGRIAVIAANQGAFSSTEDAVDRLFATGSKAKRSKVRSFALIFEELGDMLQFPEALTERRGLRLASALRRGAEDELRRALSEHRADDAEEEWAILEPLIRDLELAPRDISRGGRPRSKPKASRPEPGRVVHTAGGVTIRKARDGEAYLLRLEGDAVSDEIIEQIVRNIREMFDR
ncbi:ParB/RepB/Spo0J family partition protein [Paracoccus seriniphilus]|uniref:ParB/RepB/Spo0J family partition protein n=1 Tax=Paracoccus seriniphilus TaxID=184748 RepID=UPI003565817F